MDQEFQTPEGEPLFDQSMEPNPFDQAMQSLTPQDIGDKFYDNICDEIPENLQLSLGRKLKDIFEADRESNEERLMIISKGMEALGLSRNAAKGSDGFLNSSFLNSWLALCAESSTELFPPNNIVSVTPIQDYKNKFRNASTAVIPDASQQPPQQGVQAMDAPPPAPEPNPNPADPMEIYQIASSAEDDFNYMLCERYPDMIEEMESAISQCFIAGSCVVKIYYDPSLNRPYIKMIPPDKIIANAEATNLASADRVSHSFTLTERELRDYVNSGYFSSKNLPDFFSNQGDNYEDEADTIREEITGVTKNTDFGSSLLYNYKFVETETFLSLDEIDDSSASSYNSKSRLRHQLVPYAVTFEEETAKVVRVVRKWDYKSKNIRKIENLVQFKFLPGFDIWGLGLSHMVVSMANAATIIERELVKSARLANFPGGIMRSDATIDKSSIQLNEAEYIKVRSSDALSEVFKERPFTPPSPMLKEILTDLENKIQKISGITTIKMENMPSNIKSSALLAIIEKEIKPQSAVMRRIQSSINQALKILQRLLINEMGMEEFGDRNDLVLPEFDIGVEKYTNKEIYGRPIVVRSSADPTLTSSAAQMIRAQYMHEIASSDPSQHKMNEVYRRLYQIMRIPDIPGILYSPQELQKMQEAQAEQQAKALDQNKILMADVEQKADAVRQKTEVDKLKIQTKAQTDQMKLESEKVFKQQQYEYESLKEELNRLKIERENNRMDEQTYVENMKKINDTIISKYKTEAEIGRTIPTKNIT